MKEYFKIGKLVAVYSLKGELVLKHNLGKKSSLKGLKTIFIEERKNSFLPWFIEAVKIKSADEVYLKLEGVDAREKAMKLLQKEVWVPEADFKTLAAKSSPVNLLGYSIINNKENLGTVLEVIEQPHQVLLRIDLNGKEALIPLHAESLDGIDHDQKEIHVVLPDGLLDVYR